MAFMTDITRFDTGITRRIDGVLANLRAHRARRAAFRRTYDELAVLNDRELNDLGLSRTDIPAVARQAAAEV